MPEQFHPEDEFAYTPAPAIILGYEKFRVRTFERNACVSTGGLSKVQLNPSATSRRDLHGPPVQIFLEILI
jgi:hypothetical protein